MLKRKLLLADDSVTIQKVVNLTFADEGIDVITVGDGNAAMAKISESAPDVILADVHMPGLSGYQVCEMVRSNEATRELPVVLLVGSFEPFDENEAARVGANAFLTKPFQSIRQLVSQVSDLMQPIDRGSEPTSETPATPTSEYAAADLDVDRTIPADQDIHTPPPPRVPDTTDIDKLYLQSVGDVPSEGAETGRPTYLDAGMDDEMIDAVHAAGEPADEEPSEEFHQEPTAEYHQPTAEYQLEASGYQQPAGVYDQPQFEQPEQQYQQPEPQYQQPEPEYQQAEPQYQQPESEYQQAEPQYQQPESQYQQPEPQFQHPADDYREPVVEYVEPPSTSEQPAESVFQEEAPRAASPFDAPAEETPALELETFGGSYSQGAQDTSTARTDEFELDEVDLLELPPIEGGKTIEFTTKPGAEGGKQVVSLSPELMDALVEKVVSKLSKKE